MGAHMDGFVFNDFCQHCQKVMEHRIEFEDKTLYGVCESCGEKRPMTGANQVYYTRTDLWVTRFKIGNIQNVVEGKLLDAVKHAKNN